MITRFAPSPTGPLHLGHAYSAILAHDLARTQNGAFLLRIEDIDQTRSRLHWETQIYDDLTWLGLSWDGPVMRQSDRRPVYEDALAELWARDLLYVCTCRRRDILEALGAPQEGHAIGPDGLVYPGTCRTVGNAKRPLPHGEALRLNMAAALAALDASNALSFEDRSDPPLYRTRHIQTTRQTYLSEIGDIVLSRRDFLGSYHLSVVLDDAAQGITDVVRGADLFDATKIHVILQRLLGLPTPRYYHHKLIRDPAGKRLAKRDDARAIATYRKDGASPADIRRLVGL